MATSPRRGIALVASAGGALVVTLLLATTSGGDTTPGPLLRADEALVTDRVSHCLPVGTDEAPLTAFSAAWRIGGEQLRRTSEEISVVDVLDREGESLLDAVPSLRWYVAASSGPRAEPIPVNAVLTAEETDELSSDLDLRELPATLSAIELEEVDELAVVAVMTPDHVPSGAEVLSTTSVTQIRYRVGGDDHVADVTSDLITVSGDRFGQPAAEACEDGFRRLGP